jgi:hypothetical protein
MCWEAVQGDKFQYHRSFYCPLWLTEIQTMLNKLESERLLASLFMHTRYIGCAHTRHVFNTSLALSVLAG